MSGSGQTTIETVRAQLLPLFEAGVEAVRGESATRRALEQLQQASDSDGLSATELDGVAIVAIGKAAAAMMQGALLALPQWQGRGLVITKHAHLDASLAADTRLQCIEAGHPLPDQQSLIAGDTLLEFIDTTASDAHLLVLISGGASALVDVLPETLTLSDLLRVNDYLLAHGHDIIEMNRVRRCLSCIKGGKLVSALGARRVTQLLISDVPGDNPADVGSGLLVPGTALPDDDPLFLGLPAWLQAMLRLAPQPPAENDVRLQQVQTQIIASSALAQQAVANAAAATGFTVVQAGGELFDEVDNVADVVAATLLPDDAAAGVYIWGGEPTLTLPEKPGRGGRNQHLALLLAARLAGRADLSVLVCGTDGTDGPTADAGALVHGGLLDDAGMEMSRVNEALVAADSGELLQELGALVTTGPTGTNVMDLVIGLRG